jgi:hypothetical protein
MLSFPRKRESSYLTPCVPLSFGGRVKERGNYLFYKIHPLGPPPLIKEGEEKERPLEKRYFCKGGEKGLMYP